MITKNKYKVCDLAKDLNIKSGAVIELLAKYFDEPKKAQTALADDELDVVFDWITRKHEAENFQAYFAATSVAPEKPAEPAPEKAAEPETKPDEKPQTDEAPAQPQKPAEPAKKPAEPPKQHKPSDPQPFKSKKKDKPADGPMQARTKGQARTVDTRTSAVDLGKYDEHYDEITPEHSRAKDSDSFKKVKINQKSKQYRKKGAGKRRETEAERLKRIDAERAKKHMKVVLPEEISVNDLALTLKARVQEVIKKLMGYGVMAKMTDMIDYDTAAIIATDFGARPEKEVVVTIEDRIIDTHEDTEEDLQLRSPVVCVMGHVDHGKTSLLDAIRNTNVTAGESGGITQHIGAYRVRINDQDITFLDTPGHAAFTSMRARGAMATDIAVLVVAADDGIMPQTIEAINHAKAAGVTVIVAVNKMDKPGVSVDRVLQQLTEYELVPEEWGGDTIVVPVSAKTGMGIDQLLESILLVAEVKELKANPNRAARGIVIEARLDKGRGPIATLLVQNGTLRTGDIIVAGTAVGRVRVMTDYNGNPIKEAGPSVPVEVAGLAEAPGAGDAFDAVSDERLARDLVEKRKQEAKDAAFNARQKVTLQNLFSTLAQGSVKELNIIVKADVQGSVEAVTQSLEKLSNDEVRVKVIHGGVGAVNESDVMLANASGAIIIGFHVRPDSMAEAAAERDNVEMRMYMVIYDCIEDVQAAIKGMLAPKVRDVELGKLEVRKTIKVSSIGTIAGCYVLTGKVTRGAKIRVVRDGIVVAEDELSSLKRFKDDVKEVAQGYECGITLNKFGDIKEGDIFEAYATEEYTED